MQRREVPTHLNIEDKAFAGLTMRQLMMAIIGLALAYSAVERSAAAARPESTIANRQSTIAPCPAFEWNPSASKSMRPRTRP